jgi:hypothetical protein
MEFSNKMHAPAQRPGARNSFRFTVRITQRKSFRPYRPITGTPKRRPVQPDSIRGRSCESAFSKMGSTGGPPVPPDHRPSGRLRRKAFRNRRKQNQPKHFDANYANHREFQFILFSIRANSRNSRQVFGPKWKWP